MSFLRLTSGLEIGTEEFFKDQDLKTLYRQKNVVASEDSNQVVIYDYALASLESSDKRPDLEEFLKVINFLDCEEKIIKLTDEHFKPVAKQMLEEKKLDQLIDVLGGLEQCVKVFGGTCGREMVKVLIRIFEEIDTPPRAMCQALNAFLRRILNSESEIWAEIERLMKNGKYPDISTHLALYPHFHKLFDSDVILRCVERLLSSSAVERKEAQSLFHLLIHNQNHPNGHQELPGSLEDKREFLLLVMLLEENQQHIIDCQKGRFIRWLENKNNIGSLRLLPFSRSFNHENKKVVYSFCKLFLQNAKEESAKDEATRNFIIKDFIPTTAQLTLFVDEETDENGLGTPKMAEYMKSFIKANEDILPVIIEALASFNQSPTPLFYWILSISKERASLSNMNSSRVLDDLVNIFYLRTQKHQLKVKSATQCVIVKIIQSLKIDECRQKLLAIKLSAEIGNPAYYSPANPLLNSKERQLCAFTSQLENSADENASVSSSLKRHLDLSPKNQDVFSLISTALELYRDRLHLLNEAAIDERVTLSVFELLIKFVDDWDTIKSFEGRRKAHDALLAVCAHHAHLLNDQQKASVATNINSTIARRNNKDPQFVLMALKTLKMLLVKLQAVKLQNKGVLSGKDIFELLEDSETRLKGTTELAWQCAGYLNHEASIAECLEALSTCDITGQIAIALNLRGKGRVIDYSDEDIPACMFTLWSEIQASFGNRNVHELYGHFCELLINKHSIANVSFEQNVIQPIFKEIQKKASTRHGMTLPLLSQYTPQIYCSFPNQHSNLLIALLTSGSAFNKDVLVDLRTAKMVDHLVEEGALQKIVVEDTVDVLKEMMQVRRLGLQILASLNGEKDANEKAVRLIHILIEEHVKESKRKPRYHLNSSSHLTKERCWQSILFVICNVLHENELEGEQISGLVDAILKTLNPDEETSVRMFQSICLAKLIAIDSKQWQKFDEIIEADDHLGFGGAVSSVLVVGMLFCISVKSSQFTSALIEQCIRLQQSNNFLIRIHAIAAIKKLYTYCLTVPALKNKIDEVFPFLGRHVQFSHSQVKSGNMGRNVERVMGNLLFSELTVLRDLSLTGIFRTIPLSVGGKEINLINEELLAELYEESFEKKSSSIKFLPFQTEIDGTYKMKMKESKEDENMSRDLEDLSIAEPTDVQQKITPWIQDSEIDKKSCEGLVICASLIDKANNLGGITRTAEVFGAESLAISNLAVLKSKDYTSLAVTAMKWIDIQEVKAANLQSWLLSMKMKGYCLAGLEQTTNSISIEKFDFPKRCVVVLGNEREGIPTNIISLLDVVLEIPQKGIIRSLNVHVSAAISIWEYTRGNL